MYHLIKSTTTPIVWVLILIASGLLVAWFLRRKKKSLIGWPFVIVAGLVLYSFSIPAVSNRLLYSLERQHRYPEDEVLSDLDLLVVLGAGYRPSGGSRESAEPTGLAYARVFGGVKAFKKSRAKTLAFCEGWGEQTAESGAEVMKALAMQLGVQEDEIITEDSSQNTMDNAVQLKKLLPGQGQSHIGLVTSALHMPRSQRVFKRVFPQEMIVPVPVGYRFDHRKRNNSLKSFIPSSRALQASTDALHEWIGMLWYAIRY
jgi:uncharacterized SAM-binding protein YcdF (DUF218 family)